MNNVSNFKKHTIIPRQNLWKICFWLREIVDWNWIWIIFLTKAENVGKCKFDTFYGIQVLLISHAQKNMNDYNIKWKRIDVPSLSATICIMLMLG